MQVLTFNNFTRIRVVLAWFSTFCGDFGPNSEHKGSIKGVCLYHFLLRSFFRFAPRPARRATSVVIRFPLTNITASFKDHHCLNLLKFGQKKPDHKGPVEFRREIYLINPFGGEQMRHELPGGGFVHAQHLKPICVFTSASSRGCCA